MQLAATTQNTLRGYGLESTSDANKNLIYSLCLHPASKGVVTGCMHAFHEDCLDHQEDTLNTYLICRGHIDGKQSLKSPGHLLSSISGQYIVRCPQNCGDHVVENRSNPRFACPHEGCNHVALLRSKCVQHAEICDHIRVVCRCAESIRNKDLKAHKATACAQAPITYGYCKQGEIERGSMETHLREGCKASATLSLVKQMQDKIQELRRFRSREVQKMSNNGRFKIYLPARIRDLPFDPQGCWQMVFTDNWTIEIESKNDCVGVWLISHTSVKASVAIAIGEFRSTSNHTTFTGLIGSEGYEWGFADFPFSEVGDLQILEVTINVEAFFVKPDC